MVACFNMFVRHHHFLTHAAHELTPNRSGKFIRGTRLREYCIPLDRWSSLQLTNHATLACGEPGSAENQPTNRTLRCHSRLKRAAGGVQ